MSTFGSRYRCGLPDGHDGPCFEAWAVDRDARATLDDARA